MSIRSCPAPLNFSPVGDLAWVKPLPYKPSFIKRRKPKGRKAQGVRYEKRAHEHFNELFGDRYINSQWFQFKEPDTKARYCEIDGLLIRPKQGTIIILEMKYNHTSDAWWQTRRLYEPIIKFLFPEQLWEVAICEVVKWFDPATKFPEDLQMVKDIRDVQTGKFGLHIWKP